MDTGQCVVLQPQPAIFIALAIGAMAFCSYIVVQAARNRLPLDASVRARRGAWSGETPLAEAAVAAPTRRRQDASTLAPTSLLAAAG
jgi:hypothetical protein